MGHPDARGLRLGDRIEVPDDFDLETRLSQKRGGLDDQLRSLRLAESPTKAIRGFGSFLTHGVDRRLIATVGARSCSSTSILPRRSEFASASAFSSTEALRDWERRSGQTLRHALTTCCGSLRCYRPGIE